MNSIELPKEEIYEIFKKEAVRVVNTKIKEKGLKEALMDDVVVSAIRSMSKMIQERRQEELRMKRENIEKCEKPIQKFNL